MKIGVIYLHRNKNNKKVYIGQTVQNPQYRWNHGQGYKGSFLFYNAIQKYGWDNFQHIILEKEVPQDKLNEREKYYISLYQSNNRKYGYNLTSGGSESLNEQQLEERKEKLKEWRNSHPQQVQKSINAMQQYWKKHPEKKQQILKKATQASIEYWKNHPQKLTKKMKKMQQQAKKKTCKKVQCVQTGIIYESARQADRQTGIKYYNIGKVCNGKMKTTGGFHWKFYQEEKQI